MDVIFHDEYSVNKACIVLKRINPALKDHTVAEIRAEMQKLANQYAGRSTYASTYGFVLSFWDTADEHATMVWFAKVSVEASVIEAFLNKEGLQ